MNFQDWGSVLRQCSGDVVVEETALGEISPDFLGKKSARSDLGNDCDIHLCIPDASMIQCMKDHQIRTHIVTLLDIMPITIT
jgi:hypothetical protein